MRENRDEPTHRTMDKYQIENVPSVLSIDDLIEIGHKYNIIPYVGLIPIPRHLCDTNDPSLG